MFNSVTGLRLTSACACGGVQVILMSTALILTLPKQKHFSWISTWCTHTRHLTAQTLSVTHWNTHNNHLINTYQTVRCTLKGSWTLYWSLSYTFNVIKFFYIKKHYNLEIIGYFLSCFDPPHQNALFEYAWRIVDSEVNAHGYDWQTVVNVWHPSQMDTAVI